LNLGDSAIVLRLRSLPEIFDLAFRLIFSIASGLYARLSLFTLLPLYIACMVMRYAANVSWGKVWLFALLVEPLLEAVFTVAVSQVIFTPTLRPRTILALFAKRAGAFLGSLFVRLFGLFIGLITLLTLMPFVGVRLLLLDEACLLEGLSGGGAYERAYRLVAMRTGDAFWMLLLMLGARFAFVFVAEVLFDGLVSDLLQLGRPFGYFFSDGGSPAALFGFLLSAPYVATARFLFYIDTRTRADGWDIQLRFSAIRAAQKGERRALA